MHFKIIIKNEEVCACLRYLFINYTNKELMNYLNAHI